MIKRIGDDVFKYERLPNMSVDGVVKWVISDISLNLDMCDCLVELSSDNNYFPNNKRLVTFRELFTSYYDSKEEAVDASLPF